MRTFNGIVTLGTLALFLVLSTTSLTTTTSSVDAQETDPEAVVRDFVDGLNAGDVDAAMEVVADDVAFTVINSFHSQGGFGKKAFAVALEGTVSVHQQVELTELAHEDNIVTGVAEVRTDEDEAAGVDRVLEPFTMTLNDEGLIVLAEFTHDETDPQTLAFLEFYDDPDATAPPPGVPVIDMLAQSGSGQTGVAAMVDDPEAGITLVGIDIAPGAEGVLQPAHLHTGTCEAPGPIIQPLAWVLDGASFTFLSPFAMPLANQGLILNVHKSEAEMGVYVSCGVIQAIAVDATPTPPVPAPTASTGVAAPDTGSGTGGSGSATSWVLALGIAGAAVTMGGALRLVAGRR